MSRINKNELSQKKQEHAKSQLTSEIIDKAKLRDVVAIEIVIKAYEPYFRTVTESRLANFNEVEDTMSSLNVHLIEAISKAKGIT